MVTDKTELQVEEVVTHAVLMILHITQLFSSDAFNPFTVTMQVSPLMNDVSLMSWHSWLLVRVKYFHHISYDTH
jgi:hypothetical protein